MPVFRLTKLLAIPLFLASGCASQVIPREPLPADTNACFLRAVSVCETPGCINHQLKLCDSQRSQAGAPMTKGIRTQLTNCLMDEQTTPSEVNKADAWRRCMHLLKTD